MTSDKLFELIGAAEDELLEQSDWRIQKKKPGFKIKAALAIAAAIAALLAVIGTAAAVRGVDPVSLIADAFAKRGIDETPDQIEEQIKDGEWVALNDDNVAIIVPESPVKILLSSDGGQTWKESVVENSEGMEAFDDWNDNIVYYGGYIGFFGENGGYLVLNAPTAMGIEPIRIFLTGDGGDTWREIGNPTDIHPSVSTGAGFSTSRIGFISYKYREVTGPDIWRTLDGGETWEKLTVKLPDGYTEDYRFTPLTPSFDGEKGIYPIKVLNSQTGEEGMITMRSDDFGMTWSFA